jgi:hypothetical protein
VPGRSTVINSAVRRPVAERTGPGASRSAAVRWYRGDGDTLCDLGIRKAAVPIREHRRCF